MTGTATMSRRDRLRRVVILCRKFALNLAYYREGQRPEHSALLDAQSKEVNFWRTVNSNFLDICVLEWCKLFAEQNGKHHWSHIVSDAASFKVQLLNHLGTDDAAFQNEVLVIRQYRDKFLAHLDSEKVMNPPVLDIPKKAVWFYYDHVVTQEAGPGDLSGLVFDLDAGYAQCERVGSVIYKRNA